MFDPEGATKLRDHCGLCGALGAKSVVDGGGCNPPWQDRVGQHQQRQTVRPARYSKAQPQVGSGGKTRPQRIERCRKPSSQGGIARSGYLHFSPELVTSYWLLSRPEASAGKVAANCLTATQPRVVSPSWRIASASNSKLSGARSPLGSIL